MGKIVKLLAKYYPVYLSGLWGTLWISAVTVLLGLVLGMLVALMRMSRSKLLNAVSGVYIEVLRGTPILLQLYFFWIGLPKLVPFELSDTQCIVVALAVNASAFISEIIRAGILAVDGGQNEAARSLGLSSWQSMKLVVLPQAIKNILPALANELVTMVKESSICSVLGMTELIWGAKTVATTTYKTLSPYVLAALVYFVINYPAGKAIEAIERRMRRGDRI